jgi:adenine-specific DNA-methyltransferase
MKAVNLGVRPLPNLETRLVAADTLIPLPKNQHKQGNLFDDATPEQYKEHDRLKQELTRVRHAHFGARDPRQKRQLREEDASIRDQLRALLQTVGLPAKAARAMADWDPYDQNKFAPFFDSEWMFGIPVGKMRIEGKTPATLLGNFAQLVNETSGQTELTASTPQEIDSGFDIVIGNPPYVSSERFARTTNRDLWKTIYQCFAPRIDIYCLFYERSLDLLRTGGVLAFISSNKFLRAGYGIKFRPMLSARTAIVKIVDFGELPVFTAATDTAVVIFKRETPVPTHKFVGANIKESSEIATLSETVRARGVQLEQAHMRNEGWTFEQKGVLDLLQRIKDAGKPLEDVVAGKFFYGIKTGFNEAFVIDAETRKRLIDEDRKSDELIKPWLQGREIKRWYGDPSGLYVIVVRYNFHAELAHYPAILRHLKKFESKLKDRGQCCTSRNGDSTGQHHWLELDNNPSEDYLNYFNGTKIVFNETSKELHAFVDRERLFINKTGFILIAKQPEYVLGVLMSKVLDWLYRMEFPNWGDPWEGGRIQFRGDRMANVPIPTGTREQEITVTSLVGVLTLLNRHFATHPDDQNTRDPLMLAYLEQILNGLVYDLYFPDELHGAGLQLFDLVAQIQLPDINTIPEPDRLPRLRLLFESLYDGTHPLRIALAKLQTLDTVRIIEGKA